MKNTALFVFVLAVVALLGCDSSSPTAPDNSSSLRLTISELNLEAEVANYCSLPFNAFEAEDELRTAWTRILRETEGSREDSPAYLARKRRFADVRRILFSPTIEGGEFSHSHSDELRAGCADEDDVRRYPRLVKGQPLYGALEHEPGHLVAYWLGLSYYDKVWHSVTFAGDPM